MRRRFLFLSALLSVALLFTVCACSVTDPETPSVADSDSSAGEFSESNSRPQPETISSVNRRQTASNVAEGKSYLSSLPADSTYPDTGQKLTDGVLSSSFDTNTWVGYNRANDLQIVLDLGMVEDGLADFVVCLLRLTDYGIGAPASVLFEISEDGTSYQSIGTAYPAADISVEGSLDLGLKLAEPISARYIRFTLGASSSAWTFIGELKVLRYEEGEVEQYYGNAVLPEISEPSVWPDSEPDRDTVINLIAGQMPLVRSVEEVTGEVATEYYNSIIALTNLTDGLYAKSATFGDAAFAHFTRSSGRSLLFDFGYTSAVTGVQFCFLQQSTAGIYLPGTFSVFLSEDGFGWQRVYFDNELLSEKDDELFQREVTFDQVYAARFAKIEFSVTSHVFCDEVQIYGTKAIPVSAISIVPEPEDPVTELGYIMPEDFLSVHNVLLSYHCLEEEGQHTEDGLITVEEYLPYVGYYNEAGELVDTFFDGYLYLPYTRFNYGDYARTLAGWQFYLDDIYMQDRNMSALNQAVGQVSSALSLSDYRCTVFTSILYPWETLSDNKTLNTFGDIDGDGTNDSFDALENRKKAVRWMMDQEYSRFHGGAYENLVFGGFYWFEESLSVNSSEEKELILFAADYAHSLGVKLFWIPYYCASGYERWEEYGFDLACMQPNYMFTTSGDSSLLQYTAEKTNSLGMCVEIEMNSVSNSQDVSRYMEYLAAGAKYGYMNSVKMYYQNGVPGAFYYAYLSENPYQRAVYDLTYQFAKEIFTAEIPEYITGVLSYTCIDGILEGEKIAESTGAYVFSLSVSPSHGSLRLNSDGSFVYYANEGYTGTDRFAVILDYGYAQSEELVVTVSVE